MSQLMIVIGGNGQLGSDLIRVGEEQNLNIRGLTHTEIDIANMDSVESVLSAMQPQIVINTAACHGANQYTAADQDAFFRLNALGAWNVARWCWQRDAVFIQYSTDYVFGADLARSQPYIETDLPCPVNIYGVSKLAGELLVRSFCPRHYVLRIASVYGVTGCRAKGNSNFVKMTLGKIRNQEDMQVVADQFMTPTWTRAAALKTFDLLAEQVPYGLYHLSGSGACSWYEFACEILKLTKAAITVTPTQTPADSAGSVFLRPRYTVMDNLNLRRAGLPDMPDWRESLATYLNEGEGV
jgi:dTDP-4-dehydrorhamnose reductase